MALTPKQEKFIQGVVSGMTYSDAYRAAYNCARMKPETVNNKAYELMQKGEISARVEKARAEAAKNAQWSLDLAVERVRKLNDEAVSDLEKDGLYKGSPAVKALIDSTALLNRMTGIDKQIVKANTDAEDVRVLVPPYDMSANISPTFCEVSRAIDLGKANRIMLKGGRGSTKSSYAYQKILDVFLHRPHAQWICGRRYANTLRRSCFANVLWAIAKRGMTVGKPGEGCDFDKTTSPMEITFNKTGQKILFYGLDEPEKLKSITFEDPKAKIELLLLEEYNQLACAEDARNVRQSVFRSDYSLEIDVYNPSPDDMQWTNQEARVEEPGKMVHHSSYLDVPEEFIGKRFIEQAEQLKSINAKAYANEYMGEETGLTGTVFENVVAQSITYEDRIQIKWIRCGVDWGYQNDPFVWLMVGYDRKIRTLYIIDEVFNTETLDEANINEVKRHLVERDDKGQPIYTNEGKPVYNKHRPQNEIRADAAAPKDIATWRYAGMAIMGASKRVPVDDGIRWLQKRKAIVIDRERCPLAFQEFSRYRALEDDEGKFKGYPDKDNHTIDAVRYAVFDLIADPDMP
jgi:PBSX family phage terminase large subunit|nr:MAG TPA: large terminase [Caudoviricetes sp.]